MIKKHKKVLITSSLVTLLPVLVGLLLWNKLPEKFATHWGMDGQADGYSSLPFAVFAPPLIMLAVQWLCVWFTAKDPGNQDRNKKPFTLVLWIIPLVSNLSSYLMYALALGAEFSPVSWMVPAMGLLFAIIGNYLPKCKMNSTMGIKILWTYSSEENWNATHRFGGKVWVIGGLFLLLSGSLPEAASLIALFVTIAVMCILPICYSYRFYKKEKADGKVLNTAYSSTNRKITKGSAVFLILLLVFVSVVLFAGDLEYELLDRGFIIEADFYSNYSVLYEDIRSIEYREGNVPGMRVGGYGSFRLLMGYFQNEEFGTYVRYTYYKPDACIVLAVKGKTLVISGETAAQTQELYQQLLARCQ